MSKTMAVKLKICGITTLADARYCAGAGVDYLGFILYPGSPRYIPVPEAGAIIEWLYGPEAVGVFVNASADDINRAIEEAGFSCAQLSGDESPELCGQIQSTVIKTIHVKEDDTEETLRQQFERYADVVDYYLLDTKRAGAWGGTGVAFDWSLGKTLAKTYPIFFAGGIHAENVSTLLNETTPYAIDLSSSLESEPGVKDFDKINAFMEAFRNATS